ncbi:hypothetical protein [Thermosipho sp. 1223]|uniref:hypothetical protein n=1 Tax=Thermosipho sp. 1223 TaxID=1643332 RepID=UPI0009841C69|nr:hypothetical protein [Thermosipho sp. 1223]OOC46189.1 hypothetical protein XO09_07155 [Thermosipho sp. 1223]
MKKFLFILIISFPAFLFAVKFSLTYENSLYNGIKYFSNTFIPEFSYTNNNFSFIASMKLSNDGKFLPFYPQFYGDYYIKIKNAGIVITQNNLKIKFGNFENYDVIDSPYSLFISSLGHSKPEVSIKYEDSNFLYESRYILVTYNKNGFIDKGVNLKYYAIKIHNFTFGFEEAAVYVHRIFDFEYFSNPLPNFFIQIYRINSIYGNSFNDNSLMGGFAKYKSKYYNLYGQILIDDFNANSFFNPEHNTVDKIAWSFGSTLMFKKINLKLFHAGATKYTYQPSSVDESSNAFYYGYTYYNTLELNNFPIDYQDIYIGYKYGENNLAFMVEAEYIDKIKLNTAVELVISGTKSPINPWTDKDTFNPNFNLLNEPKLEKSVFLYFSVLKKFDIISLGFNSKIGKIFNVLKKVDANDANGLPYFAPSNEQKNILELSVLFKIEI